MDSSLKTRQAVQAVTEAIMGTKKRQIRRIFIAQGMLIGVIGTLIGLALGFGISWAGGHYHFIALAPEVYSIDYVPFAPRAIDSLIVAIVSIGISFVATIYPLWAVASRICRRRRCGTSRL